MIQAHCIYCVLYQVSLLAQMVSTLLAMQETWVQSLGWEDPLEKEMATRSPGESHGWRSLVGYSPWGYKESDMTVINALFLLL